MPRPFSTLGLLLLHVRAPIHATRRVAVLSIGSIALYLVTVFLQFKIGQPGTTMVQPAIRAALLPSRFGWLSTYALTTLTLVWAYVAIVGMAARGELAAPRARLWAFATPIAVNLLLLGLPAQQSQDVLSYLGHGLLGVLPGGNPLLQPVQAIRDTPFAPALAAEGWNTWPGITPYGILWTRIEVWVATLCGTHVTGAVLLFKGISVAASLGTARAIWVVLRRLHPTLQLQGTLLYLWNPLILTAFAAEGHNDALMILCSLLALQAILHAHPAGSLLAQASGVLTKYYSLPFVPAQLVLLWRTRRSAARFALHVTFAALLASGALLWLYAPYWSGVGSFQGVLQRTYPHGAVTVVGVIRWLSRHTALQAAADPAAQGAAALVLLCVVVFWTRRTNAARDYAASCAWIALAFALVVSPDYWSWYACMPLAWIAVGELRRLQWLAIVLTVAGRLTDPLNVLRLQGFLSWNVAKGLTTAIGALLPLMLLLAWGVRQRWLAQASASYGAR